MPHIDDYAKYLSEAASSEIAIVHEFRILYAQNDSSFHVFFEGGDDPLFYLPELRRRLKGNAPLHSHVCNGKPKLSLIRTEIHALQFDRTRYAFFVDRDYDDFLGTQITLDDRTYLTDHYSIENDVTTLESIEVLLTDFGGMSKADPAFKNITRAYQNGYDEFALRILPFSAWTISMRERGRKPNLNNVNLSNIFEITPAGRVKKRAQAFDTFRRNVGLQDEKDSCVHTMNWTRKLRKIERGKWMRGKYQLWFFRNYLLLLAAKLYSKGVSRWKIPLPLREDRIFEAVGGRLSMSGTLDAFLTQVCCA
jgi:hypothetical protein